MCIVFDYHTALFFIHYAFIHVQTIETYFGVYIRFDGAHTTDIEVPFEYWDGTCGLCGTFDDDKDNDFRLPDGSLVSILLTRSLLDSKISIDFVQSQCGSKSECVNLSL